jgi:hypothetical protein
MFLTGPVRVLLAKASVLAEMVVKHRVWPSACGPPAVLAAQMRALWPLAQLPGVPPPARGPAGRRKFKAQSLAGRPYPDALRRWLLQRRILQMVGGLTWGCPGLFLPPLGGTDNLLIMVVPVSIAGTTQRALHGAIELRPPNEALAHNNGEQAARAEKADCGRSEFLAAASHDLRRPVHALLLLIEAERHPVPAARTHPLMQQIAQAGHAISRLFNPLHGTHRRGGRCLAPPMPWRLRPGRSAGASCWSTTTRWCAPPCARCWVAVLRSARDATSGCPATWTASRCWSAGAKRGPHEHPDRGRPAPDLPGPGRLVVRDTPRHPGGARLPSAEPEHHLIHTALAAGAHGFIPSTADPELVLRLGSERPGP